jgi:hypothetical protein
MPASALARVNQSAPVHGHASPSECASIAHHAGTSRSARERPVISFAAKLYPRDGEHLSEAVDSGTGPRCHDCLSQATSFPGDKVSASAIIVPVAAGALTSRYPPSGAGCATAPRLSIFATGHRGLHVLHQSSCASGFIIGEHASQRRYGCRILDVWPWPGYAIANNSKSTGS